MHSSSYIHVVILTLDAGTEAGSVGLHKSDNFCSFSQSEFKIIRPATFSFYAFEVLCKLCFPFLTSYSNKFNLTNSIFEDNQSVSPYNHHAYSLWQSADVIKNL